MSKSKNEIIKRIDQINTHEFEKCQEYLLNFSKMVEGTNITLKKVREDWFTLAGMSFGDHDVTGKELNGLTRGIQNYLMSFQDWHRNTIEQFYTVYAALDNLDKEYIAGIRSALYSAAENLDKIEEQQGRINTEQKRITKTEKKLAETVKTLKAVTEELVERIEKLEQHNDAMNESFVSISENDEGNVRDVIRLNSDVISLNKKIKTNYLLTAVAIIIAGISLYFNLKLTGIL